MFCFSDVRFIDYCVEMTAGAFRVRSRTPRNGARKSARVKSNVAKTPRGPRQEALDMPIFCPANAPRSRFA